MKYEHPGVGLEMALEANNLSQKKFAELIGKSPAEVNHIIAGRRAITPDWAFKICAVFGGEPKYWLALQADYDQQQYQQSPHYNTILAIKQKVKELSLR